MRIAIRPVVPLLLTLVGLIATLSGCGTTTPAPVYGWNWQGPPPPGFYLVRQGDSLSVVAQRLGIRMRKLVRWNGLKPPYTIYANTLLRVAPPGAAGTLSSAQIAARATDSSSAVAPDPSPREPAASARTSPSGQPSRASGNANSVAGEAPGSRRGPSGIDWEWPLSGPLIQGFKEGDRTRQGIRLRGHAGEQVFASADGLVVYSGNGLKGYSNLIIVKHNDKYLSAYGFNRLLFVKEGERVKRGQAVAEVGLGAEGTYLLHFEVRRHGTAVDPILYLPPRQ